MSRPKPPLGSTGEATPAPHTEPPPGWNEAIDALAASIDALEPTNTPPLEVPPFAAKLPAVVSPLPVATRLPSPQPLGPAPREPSARDESGVLVIPDLAELSASLEAARSPVLRPAPAPSEEAATSATPPDSGGSSRGEGEGTDPLGHLDVDPAELLFLEEAAAPVVLDPFADPPPPEAPRALDAPPPGPALPVDGFVTRTDWSQVRLAKEAPPAADHEARLALLADELEARQAEGAPGPQLAWVAVEAARAAHVVGATASVEHFLARATAAAPQAVAPRRERLRSTNAAATQAARARALSERAFEVSERAGAERESYAVVARALRAAEGDLTDAAGPGLEDPGLALAVAFAALGGDDGLRASEALAQAGQRLGGEVGAALVLAGARLMELRSLGDRGAALRARAQTLFPKAPGLLLATFRLAGAFSAGDALMAAESLLGQLEGIPDSSRLRQAVGRWAVALAEAQGNPLLAAEGLERVVEGQPLVGLSVAERMALVPLHYRGVVDNPEGWVEGLPPEEGALFLTAVAETLFRDARPAEALAMLEQALGLAPSATFSALLAERLAPALPQAADKVRAYRAWARGDASRAGVAYLEAAAAAPEADLEALQDAALEALPVDGAFLSFAWADLAAHRFSRAAARFEAGAAAWAGAGDAALAEALRERAEDARQAETPALAVVRAMSRSSSADETLDHPRVLARVPLDQGNPPNAVAAAFRSAAMASRSVSLRVIEAAGWLRAAGQRRAAIQLLKPRWGEASPSESVSMLLRVLANPFDDPVSAASVFERLASSSATSDHRAFWLLRRAEALLADQQHAEAAAALAQIGAGPFRLEADVAHRRALWAAGDHGALDALLRDEVDAYEGAGQPERASQTLIDRAQLRASFLDDPQGASALLDEALASSPQSLAGAWARFVLAARLGDGPGMQVGLEALALQGDPDAAFLCLLHEEAVPDVPPRAPPWLPLALAPPHEGRLTLLQRTLTPMAPSACWQAVHAYASARAEGDPRLTQALALRWAESLARARAFDQALALLAEVTAKEPAHLPALRLTARVARAAGQPALMIEPLVHAAETVSLPHHRALLYLEAGERALEVGDARAEPCLYEVLKSAPGHPEAFRRLHERLTARGDTAALAELLRVRQQAPLPVAEAEALRLERATLLESLGDRAAAKAELRGLLATDAQNLPALRALVECEHKDGAYSVAAELSLRLARLETEPAAQTLVFRRLGQIYHRRLADQKLAAGAYERVLKLLPDDQEALNALSEIYAKQNDLSRALAATARAASGETDEGRRLTLRVRLATLHEKSGDVKEAGNLLRQALDEAPRSLQAIGELARYYERHKDLASRRVLLDTSLSRLHDELRRFPGDLAALRTIVPVLRWCARAAGSAATAQLLAALSDDPGERHELRAWAVPAARGRKLTPLVNPEVDEMAYPANLPPALRQVMRVLGPALSRASKPDLRPYGVTRADRVSLGEGPRAVIDALAVGLGVRGFEVFVTAEMPFTVIVEPGDPPAIILGREVVAQGPVALRFAAGYALRLVATHFDLLAAREPGAAALLTALVRQFVPVATSDDPVDEARTLRASERLAKALGRSLRTELRPFVTEMASPESLRVVADAVEETAARVGLLASGDLATSLGVYLGMKGLPLSGSSLAGSAVASALFEFALSADYELLVRALDSVS